MNTINTPIYISSSAHQEKTENICYNILHVANASSWYHRQAINDDEFMLFQFSGYESNSLVNIKMDVKIDDQINIYMVNKNYIMNGMLQTKTHLMICKNFDFFNDCFKLNKKNLTIQDLNNIQEKRNNLLNINMLFMLNISETEHFLKYNFLNYEMNIYKYLKRRFWIGDDFTVIKIYDIYENDVTNLLEEIYEKETNQIPDTP